MISPTVSDALSQFSLAGQYLLIQPRTSREIDAAEQAAEVGVKMLRHLRIEALRREQGGEG